MTQAQTIITQLNTQLTQAHAQIAALTPSAAAAAQQAEKEKEREKEKLQQLEREKEREREREREKEREREEEREKEEKERQQQREQELQQQQLARERQHAAEMKELEAHYVKLLQFGSFSFLRSRLAREALLVLRRPRHVFVVAVLCGFFILDVCACVCVTDRARANRA